MFENIIGQKKIISQLREELASGTMPQSVLFYGPDYSGKLSTALELARVLSCEEKNALWSCRCPACERNRVLSNPNLLLLGTRYFTDEISASADTFLRVPKTSTAFLLKKTVRKLIKRFDSVIWEEEGGKIRKAYEHVNQIEEELDGIDPYALPEDKKELQEHTGKIVLHARELVKYYKKGNIPVQRIRRICYWARLSGAEKRKIIILENTQFMQESSSNALLKILEEPPENVFFILITSKKSSLIKTILSRLRPYHFAPRSGEEERTVLEKIFHEELNEYGSLKKYFLAWKEINPSALTINAQKYIKLVIENKKTDILKEMEELLSGSKNQQEIIILLAEEILIQIRKLFLADEKNRFIYFECWKEIINRNISIMENLNLNPRLVLENIFLKMRAAL